MKRFFIVVMAIMLSACTVFEAKDSAPPILLSAEQVSDAVPKREPITTAGNRSPYKVLGKTYHLLPGVKGYVEEGIGSWYGTKFHGRNTANGEVYSLYEATAAHKTLPIPCFAKVTNVENGKQIIVRVNDRGPFHGDRIIDLSYAAAIKLGYAHKGTARLRVEAIDPMSLSGESASKRYYLQAGSFKSLTSAQNFRDTLTRETGEVASVITSEIPGFYRVLLGPFVDYARVEQLDSELRSKQLATPRLISE
ncbi:septal ring lytic transglycosylase RlpA family protein [Dasania marina]|uniref:septal ring lytic transglycosylase RlpA family protein n=1 Tax=Dasania marina TaxID=471499 RepID=UPI0030DD8815|tara:strand:+ start:15147 stop:15899 length:753 start_codon:yes stop_codon:yes gene_type:complete